MITVSVRALGECCHGQLEAEIIPAHEHVYVPVLASAPGTHAMQAVCSLVRPRHYQR
ncbi:hypothetical protein J2W54_004964 [Rhodococcus fascians]|nr:hypothetical protein [Rhodococcus sp. 3258]MDR6934548.1 hypothetical protein [Rhodococcus fascians]